MDYIVIMGYDEHYAGSDAGSVASLPFVEDGISRAVSMVPSEQVINAVPFYTRIWTENAGETKSRAVGMQAAMDAMQEMVQQPNGTKQQDSITAPMKHPQERFRYGLKKTALSVKR